MSKLNYLFGFLGSLWFAAVVLMLLLMAMACATIFESMHGTEQTFVAFYRSWWFKLLLALLAANVFASLALRSPFPRKKIGFAITHVSILVILTGAFCSEYWGIDGRVALFTGQSATEFSDDHGEALSIVKQVDGEKSATNLDPSIFGRFRAVEHPSMLPLCLDDVRVEVERYIPDSKVISQVVDDNLEHNPAIEVSLSATGTDDPVWVFASGTRALEPAKATFRLVPNSEQLSRLLDQAATSQLVSQGTVKIDYQGSTFEIPLEECTEQARPVGDTDYTVQVLRYFSHAMVGADNKLRNASDEPVNPAIEIELNGHGEHLKQVVFAKFPDFRLTHGQKQIEGMTVTFVIPADHTPQAPVEVLSGPKGELYVRFQPEGTTQVVSRKLNIGTPVESPWPGRQFCILRRFDHARIEQLVVPSEHVRQERIPALLIKLTTADGDTKMWLQKDQPRSFVLDGKEYELSYENKSLPFGFTIKLDTARTGYYPGTRTPRSYESHITLIDPNTGREQSRIVSMNNPAKHGGYTFYQLNLFEQDGRAASVLGVSWDPGKPVVFLGYTGLLIGMLITLGTRIYNCGLRNADCGMRIAE